MPTSTADSKSRATNHSDADEADTTTTGRSVDLPSPAESKRDGRRQAEFANAEREDDKPVWRRGLAIGAAAGVLILALATATGLLGYQLADKNRDLAELKNAAQTAQQAEQSALTYATGAATMDYKDLAAWHKKLVVNTSPDLSAKLSEAATSMEQVITPLSWTSTAQPIAAQVKSHNGDSYTVVAFVNVTTKNAQAPDGVQSTAAYTVTMDRAKNWLITDVGGMAPIGPK